MAQKYDHSFESNEHISMNSWNLNIKKKIGSCLFSIALLNLISLYGHL